MKKILLILLFSSSLLLAQNEDFFSNPSTIATRDNSSITIPLISFEADIANSLLQLDDINIFQKGNELSNSEKSLLTTDDLNINFDLNTKILNFGNKNWDFDFSIHSHADLHLLDKKFSDLILNGNETNYDYETNSGDNSIAYLFSKATFKYAFTTPFQFNQLIKNEAKNNFINYLKNMPIYYGVNVNLNYPIFYGEVLESTQNFGTMNDSLYYHTDLKFSYFELEESSTSFSVSFGFGAMLEIPKGWAYFKLDDLFGSLSFENLVASEYQEDYCNELMLFDEDYEPFQESYENDSLRVDSKKIVFHPSLELGAEYEIIDNLSLLTKYKNVQYETKNGISFGAEYDSLFPFQLICGFSDNVYYESKIGVKMKHFEWSVSSTFHHGFFRYAKGVGISSEMMVKF